MPQPVERELYRAADKLARSGKLKSKKKGISLAAAEKAFVYSTMTNMQKKGSIAPWRKLRGS